MAKRTNKSKKLRKTIRELNQKIEALIKEKKK